MNYPFIAICEWQDISHEQWFQICRYKVMENANYLKCALYYKKGCKDLVS